MQTCQEKLPNIVNIKSSNFHSKNEFLGFQSFFKVFMPKVHQKVQINIQAKMCKVVNGDAQETM